jgi:hypothetical protein
MDGLLCLERLRILWPVCLLSGINQSLLQRNMISTKFGTATLSDGHTTTTEAAYDEKVKGYYIA